MKYKSRCTEYNPFWIKYVHVELNSLNLKCLQANTCDTSLSESTEIIQMDLASHSPEKISTCIIAITITFWFKLNERNIIVQTKSLKRTFFITFIKVKYNSLLKNLFGESICERRIYLSYRCWWHHLENILLYWLAICRNMFFHNLLCTFSWCRVR